MPSQEQTVTESASDLAQRLQELSEKAADLAANSTDIAGTAHAQPFLITGLTVFVLACFVGYHVVWRVTPALHSPLMGLTNAISSVIIVGAVIALGAAGASGFSSILAFLAVMLASVNIFGGFIITRRMLHMFNSRSPATANDSGATKAAFPGQAALQQICDNLMSALGKKDKG